MRRESQAVQRECGGEAAGRSAGIQRQNLQAAEISWQSHRTCRGRHVAESGRQAAAGRQQVTVVQSSGGRRYSQEPVRWRQAEAAAARCGGAGGAACRQWWHACAWQAGVARVAGGSSGSRGR